MKTMNSQLNDWATMNLGALFGAPVKLVERPPIGSIVMGVDRSYLRSHYEVLACDGVNLLLLFRRFRHDNGVVSSFEDHGKMNLYVRPLIFFRVETDRLLKPAEGVVVKSISWNKETGWDVEYSVDGKLVHRVTEVPLCER